MCAPHISHFSPNGRNGKNGEQNAQNEKQASLSLSLSLLALALARFIHRIGNEIFALGLEISKDIFERILTGRQYPQCIFRVAFFTSSLPFLSFYTNLSFVRKNESCQNGNSTLFKALSSKAERCIRLITLPIKQIEFAEWSVNLGGEKRFKKISTVTV